MKKWIGRLARSKTMMFNLLVAGVAAFEGIFTVLQPFVAGNVFAYLTIVVTVGNAMLRTVTDTALRDK